MGDPSPMGVFGIYLEGTAACCQTIASTVFTNRSWAERVLVYLEANQHSNTPLLTTSNINYLVVWMNQENNVNQGVWGPRGSVLGGGRIIL